MSFAVKETGSTSQKQQIMEAKLLDDGINFVNLQFTDLLGTPKSVSIPLSKFGGVLKNGCWFDGSSIEGFARIFESDMFLVPDLNTYAVIPWLSNNSSRTARFICDVYTPDNQPFVGDPRNVLKRALARAAERGWNFLVGPEAEFFLFESPEQLEQSRHSNRSGSDIPRPLLYDRGGYFDLNMDKAFSIRAEMKQALASFGIDVTASHHEVAPGQHEIDFEYCDALRAADNMMTLKFTLKAVAAKHNLIASFMPKPIFDINGSGMHVHQSLGETGAGGNKNLFYDADGHYCLSQLARQFIAGQLHYIREIIGLLAPTVNSYKRLIPGYEAPVYICWARTNRSALIRIPRFNELNPGGARCELRCPDPTCNPYLAFAAMLNAGLAGIDGQMTPPEPIEEDIFQLDAAGRQDREVGMLPGSLLEAMRELESSQLIRETLGEHLFEHLLDSKLAEWLDYSTRIHPWEMEHYLNC